MADAEQTLREYLNKILDEINYKPRDTDIQAITTGGGNYTSLLFLISVSSPDKDDLKLFAKVASVGGNLRIQMSADWLYETERTVYTKLVKIYNDIQNELKVSDEHRYIFPKCYGCKGEDGKETVVMENLVESGYKSFNRFKSMDWEHARAGVENLAKFHALSFAFAKYHPEEFEKLTANMKFRIGSEEATKDEGTQQLWIKMVEGSLRTISEDYRDAVRRFVFDPNNRFDKFNTPIGKPVIAHGDYRMSNLLFKKENDKLEAITVDYQTVHAGCPVSDLIYFVTLGSDEEFRRQYFDKLLEHYYTHLEQALERLSIDAVDVYPKEKLYSDVKKLLPYSVLLGVAVLPVVTVEAESAPKLDGAADVSEFFAKHNELYTQRFSGIVSDFIKLGVV